MKKKNLFRTKETDKMFHSQQVRPVRRTHQYCHRHCWLNHVRRRIEYSIRMLQHTDQYDGSTFGFYSIRTTVCMFCRNTSCEKKPTLQTFKQINWKKCVQFDLFAVDKKNPINLTHFIFIFVINSIEINQQQWQGIHLHLGIWLTLWSFGEINNSQSMWHKFERSSAFFYETLVADARQRSN